MFTLILKIPMNPGESIDDTTEIYNALRVLVGHVHMDITDDKLMALMKQALHACSLPRDADYEIVEDCDDHKRISS